MSKARFTIAYDGSALRAGTMDVRDLAPALMAIGSLFDAANRALNGPDGPKVAVNVTATGTGSFEIALEVVQSLYEQARTFLAGEDVTAAVNLVTLVVGTGAGGGLIWLVRKAGGRKPDKVEKASPDTVRLTFTVEGSAQEAVEVPMRMLRLYQDIAVRKSLEGAVYDPLQKEGIDTFKAAGADSPPVVVKGSESESFASPEIEGSVVVDEVRQMALSIVALAFKEDRKWRFFDGNSQLSTTITDEDFLRRVDNNEPFTKGDVLRCEVRVVQRQTTSGLKSEYTVLKVVEHIPPMRQLPLPFEDAGEETATEEDEEEPPKNLA